MATIYHPPGNDDYALKTTSFNPFIEPLTDNQIQKLYFSVTLINSILAVCFPLNLKKQSIYLLAETIPLTRFVHLSVTSTTLSRFYPQLANQTTPVFFRTQKYTVQIVYLVVEHLKDFDAHLKNKLSQNQTTSWTF